jgi:hypothetical protein
MFSTPLKIGPYWKAVLALKKQEHPAAPAHGEGLGVGEGMALGEGTGVGVRIGVAVGEGEDVGVGVSVGVGVRVEVEVEAGTGLPGGGKPGTGMVCWPFTLIVVSREIITATLNRPVMMRMITSKAPRTSRFAGRFEWM